METRCNCLFSARTVSVCALAEHYDGVCQTFALELAAVVVSVEFRLLPENPYPAPLDDCFLALRYLMLNARQWDIDPTRIAVAGSITMLETTVDVIVYTLTTSIIISRFLLGLECISLFGARR